MFCDDYAGGDVIISEFAKFLQEHEEGIVKNKSCNILLGQWLKSILARKPKTNIEKIIHQEVMLAKNTVGDYLLIAKSESGRTLTNALHNFALSYEQHVMQKWLQDKNPKDFEK